MILQVMKRALEALEEISKGKFPKDGDEYTDDSMRLYASKFTRASYDDGTALREYGAELLEETAVELGVCEHKCDVEVRNKAAELRSGD